jgi:hypothetical protein
MGQTESLSLLYTGTLDKGEQFRGTFEVEDLEEAGGIVAMQFTNLNKLDLQNDMFVHLSFTSDNQTLWEECHQKIIKAVNV